MNKITLKAQNKEELEKSIKENITLQEDETYIIKENKKPFNLFFIKLKGNYEITILKKDELEKIKPSSKKEINVKLKTKPKEKEKEKEESFDIENKLKEIITTFVKKAQLNVEIEKIDIKSNIVVVNLNGKDVRYLIGEKGVALNALECLLNSIKELKAYRIQIDSNNYKAKREEALINIAKKKAEKVLKTKMNCKLSPMSARERRVIHEEISHYEGLKTESYGEEPKRFLVIKYVGEKED